MDKLCAVDLIPPSLINASYQCLDRLGLMFALLSLAPVVLAIYIGMKGFFTRDIQTIIFFGALIGNEVANKVLKKKVFKQNRPASSVDNVTSKYGMPSAHAQFMFFFTTCVILNIASRSSLKSNVTRAQILALIILACLISTSRVYLIYHTKAQIAVGAVFGTVFGIIYHFIMKTVLAKQFDFVAKSAMGRLFKLRNYNNFDNPEQLIYQTFQRKQ